MSVSNVTAPVRANNLPSMVVPVSTETDASARMVPLKTEAALRVAELPTCQKMLQASARLISVTVLAVEVVRVDAIWKIKMLFGLFCPSSVTFPVIASDTGAL